MGEPYVVHAAPGLTLVYVDFPNNARELVTRNEDGSHTALINSRLSVYAQAEAVRHAVEHIRRGDFDRLDVQTIEEAAHEDI